MISEQTDHLLKPDILERIPLLSGLPPEELRRLTQLMRIKRFSKGETVVIKGSDSDALMFLLAGHLQVIDYTEDGKEVGLNLFTPGSFFGELALIDGQPRSASIIAIEPAAVAFLARSFALELIYRNAQIAERMFKHFVRNIRALTIFRSLLAIPNTSQRLYRFLCHMKESSTQEPAMIRNLPTQQQIAIMINTSRETVSRILAELEHRGVLKKERRTLIIIQPQVLEDMARHSTSQHSPDIRPPRNFA